MRNFQHRLICKPARYNFTVSEFLAGTVDINAVVRQYCCNTETKDQARMYQFMRDLIACREGWL